MNGCIYLITNLANDKKYVGQHLNSDPFSRWCQHKTASKKSNAPLYKAMRLFGLHNFKIETIYVGDRSTLNDMEIHYANFYKSYVSDYPGGYNAAQCGGGFVHTPTPLELSIQRRESLMLSYWNETAGDTTTLSPSFES